MLDFQIERLRSLPQRKDEVWQGALVRMCSWVKGEDGRPCRPWVAAWIAVKADRISAPDLCLPNEANSARLVEGFVKFAADARLGGYRPGRVEVRDPELAEHLRGLLAGIGIVVECRKTLPALDDAMAAMAEAMNDGPPPPGALSGKGVTPERMRRFADAARRFYSAAPWKHLVDEDLLQIETPHPPSGMGFVSVLGAGGEVFGLGFHEKPKDCWDMHRLDGPAEWFQSRKRGVWQLAFDEVTNLPFGDVDLWEDHGLPVTGPDEVGSHTYETFVRNYEHDDKKLARQGRYCDCLGTIVDLLDGRCPRPRWFPVAWLQENGVAVPPPTPDPDPQAEALALICEGSDEGQVFSRIVGLGIDPPTAALIAQLPTQSLSGADLRQAIRSLLASSRRPRYWIAPPPLGEPQVRLRAEPRSLPALQPLLALPSTLHWTIELDCPDPPDSTHAVPEQVGT